MLTTSITTPKADGHESYTDKMEARIDSPEGRIQYGRCFATVEPVFGNLLHNKQLNRFTLRGLNKVDAQWKLYCLVHNIEKLAHHGDALKVGNSLMKQLTGQPSSSDRLRRRVCLQ